MIGQPDGRDAIQALVGVPSATAAPVESSGGPVSTLSGNLTRSNLEAFTQGGLEATPAFKLRQRLGFTTVVEEPTAANGHKLIMKRP